MNFESFQFFEDHILLMFMKKNRTRETSPDNQGPDNQGSTVQWKLSYKM